MKRSILVPVAVALACVFFDVYQMGIPMTLWGLILVVAIRLVQIAWAVLRKEKSLVGIRAKRAVIYSAGAALIILGIAGNVKLAASRATRVATAVKQYRAATGDYPERLLQLVPAYLSEIPNCCIRASHQEFRYVRLADKPHPILFWVAVVPFGKGSYYFERDELKPIWD